MARPRVLVGVYAAPRRPAARECGHATSPCRAAAIAGGHVRFLFVSVLLVDGPAVVEVPGPQVAGGGDREAPHDRLDAGAADVLVGERRRTVSVIGVKGGSQRTSAGPRAWRRRARSRCPGTAGGPGTSGCCSRSRRFLAFRPSATVSQVKAIASRASSPRAASHLSGRRRSGSPPAARPRRGHRG